MKKNRFIKLASGLLVLCLMTTCVIGATLAKYTTAKDTQDSAARGAKCSLHLVAVVVRIFHSDYILDFVHFSEKPDNLGGFEAQLLLVCHIC